MAGYAGSALSAENQAAIRANKADLYELDSMVMNNKHGIYAERSMIEENRAMIAKNYAAAFMGNRQEANTNTDEIFKSQGHLGFAPRRHSCQSEFQQFYGQRGKGRLS